MSQPVTYACDGGLDLISAPVIAQPGALIDCKNIEVAGVAGYTRISGFVRHDGGETGYATRYLRVRTGIFGFDADAGTSLIAPGAPLAAQPEHVIYERPGALLAFVPTAMDLGELPTIDTDATAPPGQPWLVHKITIEADGSRTLWLDARAAREYRFGVVGLLFRDYNYYQVWAGLMYPDLVTAGSEGTRPLWRALMIDEAGPVDAERPPAYVQALDATARSSQTDATACYANIRTSIEPVPGQGVVQGLFWAKGALYAIRDLTVLRFKNGTAEPHFGASLVASWGGAFAGTATGRVLAAYLDSGDWAAGTAAGRLVLRSYLATGTMPDGEPLSIGGIQTLVADLAGDPPEAVGAAIYKATGTRNGLASFPSWVWQDLGWSVNYRGGVAPFKNRAVVSDGTVRDSDYRVTDWRTATAKMDPPPGLLSEGDDPLASWIFQGADGGGIPLADALAEDDGDTTKAAAYGAIDQVSPPPRTQFNRFGARGFGFTDADIPAGAQLAGIEVQIVRRAGFANGNRSMAVTNGGETTTWAWRQELVLVDDGVQLIGADGEVAGAAFGDEDTPWPVGSYSADDPTVYQTATYGSRNDRLQTTLSSADIKDAAFGVQVGARIKSYTISNITADGSPAESLPAFLMADESLAAMVTCVRVRAHYLPPNDGVYFWDPVGETATTGKIHVINSRVASGETDSDNAAGTIHVSSNDSVADVADGWEIRTWPPYDAEPAGDGDGSTLIGIVDGTPTPGMLEPSQDLSDGTRVHKYEFVNSNFYARRDLDATYFVNGVGPARMFDGTYFCPIWTGLDLDRETPLHLCAHQNHLVLGYEAGTAELSSTGDPLVFDATRGAAELGFGSTIVGLRSMNGDALAVFTEENIQMIQGQVDASPYQSIITPDLAVKEYTIATAGQFMFASRVGIHTLATVQAYGDFKPSNASAPVWPWLRERVQRSALDAADPSGVIGGYVARAKGQYRLLFGDGWQLTATFLIEGAPPQYTLQHYTYDGADMPWNVICTAIDNDGMDRIFAASDAVPGQVYELDVGPSFDTEAIDAHFDLCMADQKTPWQGKRYSDMTLFGQAVDYAAFDLYRSGSYTAIGGPGIAHAFGSAERAAVGETAPFATTNTVQIEGRGVNLRVAASDAYTPGWTVQAITLELSPQGAKRG